MKALLAKMAGSCLGIGYLPFAPGTFASVFAVICYLFIPFLSRLEILIPAIILSTVIGTWAGGEMEKLSGREDPSEVVIDELAGQWIALAAIPHSTAAALLSLAFFRLFDILKPGAVDRAQRLPGGFGIMADDILAGLFANIAVQLTLLLASFLPYRLAL